MGLVGRCRKRCRKWQALNAGTPLSLFSFWAAATGAVIPPFRAKTFVKQRPSVGAISFSYATRVTPGFLADRAVSVTLIVRD